MASIQELKREFTKAIQNNTAAIFAGAGMSCASGLVDWKGLMRNLASDIRLDVDKEEDLVSVAQYYYNEKAGRGAINQKLMNCFTNYEKSNKNMEILARLPIDTYWTTNYDTIIEDELKKVGKTVEVKRDSENFAVEISNADVTVFKMHGDIDYPSRAVLTKDDYESYNQTRQVFSTALQGDLVKKTFLFIGCSMTDPNMKYILSRLRLLLQDNQRTHYCLLQKILEKNYRKDGKLNELEYEYACNKRSLEIRDLHRYGIDVVEYNEHADVTQILREIQQCHQLTNVYLSGSARVYGEEWKENAHTLLKEITSMCFKNGYKITTGYGDGVGSFIISTILEKVLDSHDNLDKYLCLRPFPYDDKDRPDYDTLKYKYRYSMIEPVGISIFLFGNKEINGNICLADGVYEEYKICKKMNKIIIPIGSTGCMAAKILQEVEEDIDNYEYLKPHFDVLKTEKNVNKLTSTIQQIIATCYNNVINHPI